MKCVVLCAGYATRMYPLTFDKPKSLLDIKGKPILEHIIENVASEVDKIYVVSNDKFYNHFAWWLQNSKTSFKDKVEIIDDGSTSNENRIGGLGDLWLAIEQQFIDDDLLVILGDNYFTFSLKSFIDFFNEYKKTVLGVVEIDKDKSKNFGVVEIEDNKIVGFEEKPEIPKSNTISTGIYIFSKEDIEWIKEYMKTNLSKEGPGHFVKYLLDFQDVYAFKFYGNWHDIGSLEEYEGLR